MAVDTDTSGAPSSRPDITAALSRGVLRLLSDHGLASLLEVPLSNGRRADVIGLDRQGVITIVEIKSCVADFEADGKWHDYREYCDDFFFAVPEVFPLELIPQSCGLIVADGFGGEILRNSIRTPVAAPRRKAMTLAFARLAAARLLRD